MPCALDKIDLNALLQLDDGLELSFTDKRRFARVRLLKDVFQFLIYLVC